MATEFLTTATGHMSSHEAGQGECVAAICAWRTSSHSGGQGECVEVAPGERLVGVRDTKNRSGGHLEISRETWRAFLDGLR